MHIAAVLASALADLYLDAFDEVPLAPSTDQELKARPRKLSESSHGASSHPPGAPDNDDPRVFVVSACTTTIIALGT